MERTELLRLGTEIAIAADFFNQRICQFIANVVSDDPRMFYLSDEDLRDAIRAYVRKNG